MLWLLDNGTFPKPAKIKYVWAKVSLRYETEKALLVLHNGVKVWLPKSRIRKLKFRRGSFLINVPESNLFNQTA